MPTLYHTQRAALIFVFVWLGKASETIERTTEIDITNASENDPLSLHCLNSEENVTITWSFTSSSTGENIALSETTDSFLLTSSSQTGVYTCAVKGIVIHQINALNYSEPDIYRDEKSIIFVQEEVNQSVKCAAYSYPTPTLTWSVTFASNTSKRITLQENTYDKFAITDEGKGLSVLTISKVTFEERGVYYCTAKYEKLNLTLSTSVLIRIHDRLAPLWPFLGILLEIIFVACIVSYARGKAKRKALKEFAKPFPDEDCSEYSSDSDEPVRKRYLHKLCGEFQ